MEDKPGDGLPAAIATAWGLRAPAAKGPKPALASEQIVAAGVALADAEGLGAVSMNSVARRLGSAPMSLYRHVESKDDLVALMVDRAMGPPPGAAREQDWRAGLERWADALVEAMRAHPWTTHVPIAGPPIAPNEVGWFDDALGCLRETRLAEGEKASIVLMLSGYVRNHVMVMTEVSAYFLDAAPDPDRAMRGYSDMLKRLIDGKRFPALHAVLEAGVLDHADPPDEEFAFGLQRLLDGVDALVRARGNA